MSSALNRPSLTSLPPEILIDIFESLIKDVGANDRSLTAMLLSHVCRSFRMVAMDYPQLWTCISRKQRRPGLQLLEASIKRSGNLPLDVVVWAYIPSASNIFAEIPFVLDRGLDIVLPHANRWRSFSLRNSREPPPKEYCLTSRQFLDLHNNLLLPILEDFEVFAQPIPRSSHWHSLSLWPFYSSWQMPSLRAFSLEGEHIGMMPLRKSPYFTHIKRLSVKYVWSGWLLTAATSIVHMTSLSTLHVMLDGRAIESSLNIEQSLEIPQVTDLHVEIRFCRGSKMYAKDAATSSLFAMIAFPNLTTLKMSLHVDHARGVYPLHGILVRQNAYPFLDTLEIFVDNDDGGPEGTLLLILPHCYVPSLKHLHIRSPLLLVLAPRTGMPYKDVQLREGTTVVITLRSITLDIPFLEGTTAWLYELVMKMQDQNCWDTFSEVVVRSRGVNCGLGDYVVPRDTVQRWCMGYNRIWNAAEFFWDF